MLSHKLKKAIIYETDITLDTGDFTDVIAASKGWEDVNTSRVAWNTTNVVLSTQAGFSSANGYLANRQRHLSPNVNYTYRCYLSAKSGTGTPRLSVTVFDVNGSSITAAVSGTVGWITVTFTATTLIHNFYVEATNLSDVNSTLTVTDIQLYRT